MNKQKDILLTNLSLTLPEKYLGLTWKKVLITALFIIIIGIYVGDLFFGKNSLEALWQLQEYKNTLITEIKRFKQENALTQKEYFELKEITSSQ